MTSPAVSPPDPRLAPGRRAPPLLTPRAPPPLLALARAALLTLPVPAAVARARAAGGAPVALQPAVPAAQGERLRGRLGAAGAVLSDGAALELMRILAGWPRLGAEVDDKAIPQEVRYDEIGGLSYTKGCYTGQETVARLHFRRHPHRQLRGPLFDPQPPAAPAEGGSGVSHAGRARGRATGLAFLPAPGVPCAGRWLGLAVFRSQDYPRTQLRAHTPTPTRPNPHHTLPTH